MINFLVDGLPESVDIMGVSVPIVTGYRASVRFEKVLRRQGADPEDVLDEALRIYFPGFVFNGAERDAAVDAIIWFYLCGKETPKEDEEAEGYDPTKPKSFDYDHDAGYVYASFKQAYDIDLLKEDIHWWQFRALFDSLPEDTMLMKVIGYRTAKVPSGASAETRQRIEELRRAFELPLDADLEELKTDLEDILMKGGNPAALLAKQQEVRGHGIRRDTEI